MDVDACLTREFSLWSCVSVWRVPYSKANWWTLPSVCLSVWLQCTKPHPHVIWEWICPFVVSATTPGNHDSRRSRHDRTRTLSARNFILLWQWQYLVYIIINKRTKELVLGRMTKVSKRFCLTSTIHACNRQERNCVYMYVYLLTCDQIKRWR